MHIFLLHFKKDLAFSTYFLLYLYYFEQWAMFVLFQINADFQINHLKNIFIQDTLRPSFIEEKVALSITEDIKNIKILPHFYNFSQSMWCAVSQINTKLLIT